MTPHFDETNLEETKTKLQVSIIPFIICVSMQWQKGPCHRDKSYIKSKVVRVCNKFLSFWLVNRPASGNSSGTQFIHRYGLNNAKLGCQTRLSCATLRFFILTWPMLYSDLQNGSCSAQPLTEDNLWRKMTFDRRRPLMEDNLWWREFISTLRICYILSMYKC